MPRTFTSSAVVLLARDQGESDRLVTFYSQRNGKVRGIAKGAKRSRHRFVNALEPFTLVRLMFVPPRTSGLARVEHAEVLESFPPLRSRVQCYAHASLCCELVDLWTREGDAQGALFDLLLWYLQAAASGEDPAPITLFFQTRLLALVGYAPEWDRCLRCSAQPATRRIPFGVDRGAPLCSQCRGSYGSLSAVTLGTLRTLAHVQVNPLNRLCRLKVSDAILAECWNLVQASHCHHLQRQPASYRVLTGLKPSDSRISAQDAQDLST